MTVEDGTSTCSASNSTISTSQCSMTEDSKLGSTFESLYLTEGIDTDRGKLYQQYTGLDTSDTKVLAANYFYSVFAGVLTLFQMLLGTRNAFCL